LRGLDALSRPGSDDDRDLEGNASRESPRVLPGRHPNDALEMAIELALIIDPNLGCHTRRWQSGAEQILGPRDAEVHEMGVGRQTDLVTKRPAPRSRSFHACAV
jgi:hypothetical protein